MARVTTIARGGLSVTVNVSPYELDRALAASKMVEKAVRVELTLVAEEDA